MSDRKAHFISLSNLRLKMKGVCAAAKKYNILIVSEVRSDVRDMCVSHIVWLTRQSVNSLPKFKELAGEYK